MSSTKMSLPNSESLDSIDIVDSSDLILDPRGLVIHKAEEQVIEELSEEEDVEDSIRPSSAGSYDLQDDPQIPLE
jgi:hypothetical protein